MKKTVKVVSMVLILNFILYSAPQVVFGAYSTSHPNTHTNTGNQAADIAAIAKTQIGYTETKNHTKYNAWHYGRDKADPWCAIFISWCANQAGIPTSIIAKNARASGFVTSTMAKNPYGCPAYAFSSRTPQTGDIIFVNNDDDIYSDHVGLVVDVDGTYIYTVEGNTSDQVSNVKYLRSTGASGSAKILFYAAPDYTSGTQLQYNHPQGVLDIWSGGVGTVRVRGWAFDEDDLSQSIPVHVYVGGPAGDPNAEGYPIVANTFRDDVNATYGCGNYHGFDASIPVSKTGTQPIYIYACNIGHGSTQLIAQKTVTITSPDTEVPAITNVRIENLTNQGYDVICNVTDNLNVNRVQFVTWSDVGGQDDIAPGWENNSIVSGTKNSDGTYAFHVSIAEHQGNRGVYHTHIYAYDDYGNYSGYPVRVTVPWYDYCFDEITLSDSNLYVKGWAAAANGFDSLRATLTDSDGKSIACDVSNRYYRADIEALRPDWNTSLTGFSESFDISELKTGNIKMMVEGTTDGVTYILYRQSIPYNDTEAPVITEAKVTDITNQGYTVTCHVTDNVEINRVQFATWSDAGGQDDIAPAWETNPSIAGVKNNDGAYEFHVSIDDHLGNRGLYYTHIYAFDDTGNASYVPLTPIVPGYDASFDSATLENRNLTVSGWAASINGIENIKLTVTDRKGKTAIYDITDRFSREDVTSLRPDWNTEGAGYRQAFDLSELASGSAVVEITGELYQEDVEKATYSLGKKVIELQDSLSVEVNVNQGEYMTAEPVEISLYAAGEEALQLNIYHEEGLYDSINIGAATTYIRAFDEPGAYYVNAKAIGYEESLLSDNVSFTILEEPELEPDAEAYDNITITHFAYQAEGRDARVEFSALHVPETAILYIAAYNADGRLLEVQAPALNNGAAEALFAMEDVYSFQAFIWETGTLKPLTAVEILEI